MSFGTQTHRPIAQLKSAQTATVSSETSPAISEQVFTITIPDNTKKLLIKSRDTNVSFKLNFASIDSTSEWVTIPKGVYYYEENLNLIGQIAYLKVVGTSKVIEVLSWI